jgi:hypothetical protein
MRQSHLWFRRGAVPLTAPVPFSALVLLLCSGTRNCSPPIPAELLGGSFGHATCNVYGISDVGSAVFVSDSVNQTGPRISII